VLGAFVLETGQQYLAYHLGASQLYLIAYALVFLLIMLLLPRGILPTIADRRRRRRRAAQVDAPQDPTAAGSVGSRLAVPGGGRS
jgi:branched-chain amino acid transport system permease protein